MVLAMGFEADVLQHDDLVVAVGFLEGAVQQRHRILVVTAEKFAIRAYDPVGSAEQPFPLRVVAGPSDQGADRLLGLGAARPGYGGSRPLGAAVRHRQGRGENSRHQSFSFYN